MKTSKKLIIGSIALAFVFVFLIQSYAIAWIPIDDPTPDPPTTFNLYGYVKDSYTGAAIKDVDVSLRGTSYSMKTNSYGRFEFRYISITTYTVDLSKSGYYSTSYSASKISNNGKTSYIDKQISVRFFGNIIENTTIDNIGMGMMIPMSLNFATGTIYSPAMNDLTVYARIYDRNGNYVHQVTTDADGNYDTGYVTVRLGTVCIHTFTVGDRKFIAESLYEQVYSDSAFEKNFQLERDVGEVSTTVSDLHMNYYNLMSPWSVIYSFGVSAPGAFVYDPASDCSEFTISTWYNSQGIHNWFAGDYFQLRKSKISVYGTNHWSNEYDFISTPEIVYGATSYGTGYDLTWKFTAGLGFNIGEEAKGSVGVIGTISQPDNINHEIIRNKQVSGNEVFLGSVEADYRRDVQNLNKDFTANFLLGLLNNEGQSMRQCGAHFTFRIVFDMTFGVTSKILFINTWMWWTTVTHEITIGSGWETISDDYINTRYSLLPAQIAREYQ